MLIWALAPAAYAQSPTVADFYRGKNVHLLIGVNVGASYDLEGRLIARHLGRFIPGNPTILPQNMLGGGGIVMANYLQNIAAKDGTYLGMMPNTLPMAQAVGLEGVRYDVAKFAWLGSVMPQAHSALVSWTASGVKSIDDIRRKEVSNGASPKGSFTYTMPAMINELLGAKMKLVAGYQGINTIFLALERGEVETVAVTWNDFEQDKADWIREKKIQVLVQSSPKSPTLPDVPTVEDLLPAKGDRILVDLLLSGNAMGRPLAASPETPPERAAALRNAFEAMRRDSAFIEDAARSRVTIGDITGEMITASVARVLATPRAEIERGRKLLE
jgi:tripartite-type tricarboxylate transporter receptor subunit TctC